MKKCISLILAFVFVIGICASAPITITANAVETSTKTNNEDYLYFIRNDDNTYMLYDCDTRASGEVVVPAMYNGLPVTIIDGNVFDDCNNVENIVLPDTIIEIGSTGFYGDAFYGTAFYNNEDNWIDGVLYCGNYLIDVDEWSVEESVTIKADTKLITAYAFRACEGLKSITIPDSVKYIGNRAFYECSNLESVNLPDNILNIGSGLLDDTAYYNNLTNWDSGALYVGNYLIDVGEDIVSDLIVKDGTNAVFADFSYKELTNITIPASVSYINVERLSHGGNVTVSESNVNYSSVDGILFNKDKTEILLYPYSKQDTSYIIPEGVTKIGDGAFLGNYYITSVIMPDTVTCIGNSAFENCMELKTVNYNSDLREINFSSNLTEIGYAAFRQTSLTGRIVLPGKLKIIRSHAFNNAIDGLCPIYIPASVTEIEDGWALSSGFTTIEVVEDNPCYTSVNGVLYNKDKTKLIRCPGKQCKDVDNENSYTVPNGVTTIGCGAFAGSGNDTIILPNTLITIEDEAFYNSSIKQVTLPDSLKNIGDEAFIFSDVSKIVVPDSVISIGNGAFAYSTLTSIVISDNVKEIKRDTFSECDNLVSVDLGSGVTAIGEGAFNRCGFTSLTIPHNVKYIGVTAFSCCYSLESISLGDGVAEIEKFAFYDCDALKEISIPKSVKILGDCAFGYCDSLEKITFNSIDINYSWDDNPFKSSDAISEVVVNVPVGTEKLDFWNVYDGLGLSDFPKTAKITLNISSSVKEITNVDNWFSEINVDNSNPNYSTVDGVLFNKDKTKLICYPQGKEGSFYTIPNSVTSIGDNAFEWCNSLTSITIPNGVTSIGKSVFYQCNSLKNITIPGSVTSIGANAFYWCHSLESVIIGDGVKSIDESAFWECDSLKNITIPGSVTSIGEYAFYNCDSLTSINIPTGVKSIGSDAFGDCDNLNEIILGNGVKSISNTAFKSTGYVNNVNNYENGVLYLGDWLIAVNDSLINEGNLVIKEGTKYVCGYSILGPKIKELTIPSTLIDVGENNINIEDNCINEIIVAKDNPYYSSEDGILFNKEKTELIACPHWKEINSYVIPGTVKKVSDRAFFYSGVSDITFPEGITSIGEDAFGQCVNLRNIVLPDSLTHLGAGAFWNSKLSEIILPDNLVSIGQNPFYGTPYCNDEKNWENGALYINNYLIEVASEVSGNFKIKEGTKIIANNVMVMCSEVTGLEIPNSVTNIGANSFAYCGSLESVQLPDNISRIEDGTFSFCYSLADIEIPDSVTYIGENSFLFCALESVIIPDGVKEIGETAFGYEYDFEDNVCVPVENFTIYGAKGSCAEKYATENGFTFIENVAHTHNYTSIVTKQPTCTEKGVKTFSCSCGDTYTESIKAIGHKWNNGTVTTQPTCTTQGEKTYVCEVCYEAKSELISATGHKEVVIPAVAPTFTTVGKTEGKKCSVCGTITVAQKDVAKLTLATPVVTVKNSATGVKVTWKAIDGAESYKVYRKTYSTKTKKYGSWKTCGTVTKTSYVDTNAKSGTKYIYTVKAFNGDTKSGIKNSSSILFLSQPTVKIANASTGVKVKWNKITGATGYKVYRSEYTNGKWTGWKSVKTITKGSTVSWTDTKAKSGVKYKYTVKAVNGKTASTYKSSSSLLYLAQPKVAVKALSNGIKVAWVQSTGATSYKIYRSEYNAKTKKWSSWKSIKTAKSTSKSYTDKSAKKGVKYRYTVKAVKGKVASSYKASSSVKR